ncbi:MAG: hypothetical protein AAF401_13690, partial [Pseudomonadota bacterium]
MAISQISSVFDGSAFTVSGGPRDGNPVTNASNSVINDIYVFDDTAENFTILIDDQNAGPAEFVFEDNVGGQLLANDPVGLLGADVGDALELESILTFVPQDPVTGNPVGPPVQ